LTYVLTTCIVREMPPPCVKLSKTSRLKPQIDKQFPTATDFQSQYNIRKQKALCSIYKRIEHEYLPGLYLRLTRWLETTLSLKYEEVLPQNLLGNACFHEETIAFLRSSVHNWFTSQGYSVPLIWISSFRFLLLLSAEPKMLPVETIVETNCQSTNEEDPGTETDAHSVTSSIVNLCSEPDTETVGTPYLAQYLSMLLRRERWSYFRNFWW